jgi:hypothetical protein
VQQVINAEKGMATTVTSWCSAIGNFVSSFMIFKGKRKKPGI